MGTTVGNDCDDHVSQVYAENIRWLCRYFRRSLPPPANDCADLAQEVIIRYAKRVGREGGEKVRNVRAFLNKIAVNVLKTWLARRRLEFVGLEECEEVADMRPSPEDAAISEELFRLQREAHESQLEAEWTEEERKLLKMRRAKMTNREIAAATGEDFKEVQRKMNAVQAKLRYRVVRDLRERLGGGADKEAA